MPFRCSKVVSHACVPLVVTWLLLILSVYIPVSTANSPPFFDLSHYYVDVIYLISESGKYGIPFIVIIGLFMIFSEKRLAAKACLKQGILITLTALIFAGGGALLNEHLIKVQLNKPRPNIVWLAGVNGTGPLGMTSEEFYAFGDKQARRDLLSRQIGTEEASVVLTPSIRAHWIHEAGYSFPSGHSFSAMFFATFFLMLGAVLLTSRRLYWLYLLLPWAVAVCVSRVILGVHSPLDIITGALQGGAFGLLAWFICMKVLIKGDLA